MTGPELHPLWFLASGRWDLGSDGKEDGARREPMRSTALRLAKLVSADRGLIVLATLFGVCTALCVS